MLGAKSADPDELKTTILEVITFIKEKIGEPPDYYEILLADNEATTLI